MSDDRNRNNRRNFYISVEKRHIGSSSLFELFRESKTKNYLNDSAFPGSSSIAESVERLE